MNEIEKRIEREYYIRINNGEGFSIKAVYEVKSFGGDICRNFWFENGDGKQYGIVSDAISAFLNNLYFNGDIELSKRDLNKVDCLGAYLDHINDIFFGDCDCLLCDNNHYAEGLFVAFDEIDVLFLKAYFSIDKVNDKLLNMETVAELTYPDVYLIEGNRGDYIHQMTSYTRLKEKVEKFAKMLDEKKEFAMKGGKI